MNLVALLIAPAVVTLSPLSQTPSPIRFLIALVALVVIVTAVAVSSRRKVGIADDSSDDPPSSPTDPQPQVKQQAGTRSDLSAQQQAQQQLERERETLN